MLRVLIRLADKKLNNNTRIITDNGRACASQCQKANAVMNLHTSVTSLMLTKEDRGVKRTLNRTLRTEKETNDVYPGITTSEIRAALFNLITSKAADKGKVNPRPSITWSQRRFRSYYRLPTNPGSRHPSYRMDGSLTSSSPRRTARIPKTWTATVQYP